MSADLTLFDTDGPSWIGREPVLGGDVRWPGDTSTVDVTPSAGARWHDPATSWQAAASISRQALKDSNLWVLGAVHQLGPCRDADVEALAREQRVKWSAERLRSARAWLVEHGYVQRAGTGLSPRLRPCNLWEVTS